MSPPLYEDISQTPRTKPRSALLRAPAAQERRSEDELWQHYMVEKELADRLRHATREERRRLYTSVYEELFRRLPNHPQLTKKIPTQEKLERIEYQLRLLRPWLTSDTTFLEVGAGDCALSFAVARYVTHAYAVDVSETIARAPSTPKNFTLLISDGSNIPVPDGIITLAFSDQLMEHLHPDDALDQLADIYRSLAPGGTYVCVTPNRLTGPHDISRYFEETAAGFHLKEYTMRELIAMFKRVGFKKVVQCVPTARGPRALPNLFSTTCERAFQAIPRAIRARISRGAIAKFLELRIIATK